MLPARRMGASLHTWRLKALQGCGTGELIQMLHMRPLSDGERTRKRPQPVSWIRRDLQEGGLKTENTTGFLWSLGKVLGERREATRTSQIT